MLHTTYPNSPSQDIEQDWIVFRYFSMMCRILGNSLTNTIDIPKTSTLTTNNFTGNKTKTARALWLPVETIAATFIFSISSNNQNRIDN